MALVVNLSGLVIQHLTTLVQRISQGRLPRGNSPENLWPGTLYARLEVVWGSAIARCRRYCL